MDSSISGHHVEVTPAMYEYAHARIISLKRRCDSLVSVDITFTVERQRGKKKSTNVQKACAKLVLAGQELHVTYKDVDLYVAIDGLRNKVARHIIRYNGVSKNHRRHGCPKRGTARITH